IPADERLSSPTIREVAEQLDAEVLYGEEHLDWLAYRNLIIAMRIRNYLNHLTRNALLITAGDRSDVLLSALQAHRSQNYPQLAGIVLTGGLKPPESVALLLEGLGELVPVLSVQTDTYDTAALVSNIRSYITADNWAKINLSLKLFEEYVDTAVLETHLGRIQATGMTPRMFLYSLMLKAQADKKRIVLPEGTDERILRAAEILLNRGIVDLVLLGDPREVQAKIRRLSLNINLDEAPIIDPHTSPKLDEYAQTLYELRRDRGLLLDSARDLMQDVAYYGTMMVYRGDADGMVSGAAHTTAHTIRPALQFVKTKPGFSVVSSVFFMALDDRVVVYGDCAVVPNPTAEQLAEIAISSADTARTFGIEPRVAMLSYSTGESGRGADVEKVRRATELAHAWRPDLILEGPMQYDAAVSPQVAAAKMPGSRVAGRATVLIFPDLNTGNNTYKAVQRETGAIAIGPVLQGLKKPVNDLSRGCTVEDVVNTVAITAIQAQEED
ncbi:MAG TPA: phosphate acetyltransferase, partial [Anaerolineae bacterium]|nr:phosphate acetyltransferase [Anaerolineae bacterium]